VGEWHELDSKKDRAERAKQKRKSTAATGDEGAVNGVGESASASAIATAKQ